MPIPVEVRPLENYRLWLKYSDGIEGIVDLSDLAGKGVFSIWDNYQVFQQVQLTAGGEIAWGAQVDLCPDALYLKITGKQPEDIFPKLAEIRQHA
jgi:hypothetical protein